MEAYQKMPRGRSEELVIQEVEDEILIYDLRDDNAICLNPTAKFVWEHCNGKATLNETATLLGKNFRFNANKELVRLTLKELSDANLLDNDFVFSKGEPQVSRRDLITRYGIPIATLPIVMSLVAPLAVRAQSCVVPSQPCTIAQDCCEFPSPGFASCSGGVCVPE